MSVDDCERLEPDETGVDVVTGFVEVLEIIWAALGGDAILTVDETPIDRMTQLHTSLER